MTTLLTTKRELMIFYAMLVVLFFGALLSIGRIVTKTYDQFGGIDIHPYWFSGHFIRQGKDPYGAFHDRDQPSTPVTYLDGWKTEVLPISQQGLAKTPALTPALVLLLSPLAFLSWTTAKTAWIIANLALMLVIPLLTVRLLPFPLERWLVLLVSLIFIGLLGTRVAVWTGQPALLVFALMLGSLLTLDRRWLLSGFMLGLALSKFSIALPVFLFVAYKRRYRVLAVSLLVQFSGLLILSLIGRKSPIDVLLDYIQIPFRYLDSPGVHLASLFDYQPALTLFLLVGISIVVLTLLWRWLPAVNGGLSDRTRLKFSEYQGLAALFLCFLLAAYHRVYDTVLVIVFIALLIFSLVHERGWQLHTRGHRSLSVYLIVFTAVMMLPGTIMGIVLSGQVLETWLLLVDTAMTLALLSALFVSLLLLRRL